MYWRRFGGMLIAACLLASGGVAAGGSSAGAPAYFLVRGGGFLFNYREAQVTWSVVVMARQALPQGAYFEAEFENPAGGDAMKVARVRWTRADRIGLTSPRLQGVRKGRDYQVVVRLLDRDRAVLQEERLVYRSKLDQSVLPKAPLVVGPGYAPNPAGSASSAR